MSEQLVDYQTLHQRFSGDEGSVRRNVAVVGAGGLVLAAGAYLVASRFIDGFPGFPEQIAAPDESEISVETLAIEPVAFDCRSLTASDVGGSTVRTKFALNDSIKFGGHGATAETGVVGLLACADTPDVLIETRMIDGEQVKIVQVNQEAMVFQANFIEEETLIVQTNPPETQILGGAVDIVSGGATIACQGWNIAASKSNEINCDAVGVISNWNNTTQAELERAFRVAILNTVQQDCAPLEWMDQTEAITDSYKQQAVDAGFPHESVIVEFVDANGAVATDVPNFTRSITDVLYAEGVLTEQSSGSPELEFETSCTPLNDGYQPKFN